MKKANGTKYVFVTGGVYSSLGKGLTAASIGSLLKQFGLKVSSLKLDPYLNVDPGTMSPYQHGEVYVTKDGTETDLDLGHYERFLGAELTALSSITAGKIYNRVITAERRGEYAGKTIQVIPHVTDQIKQAIYQLGGQAGTDVVIVEIGGTIGDIESVPFIEAIRQMKHELPDASTAFLHVVPLIEIPVSKETKTKPLQHSVNQLRAHGIEPDLLLVRSPRPLEPEIKAKIAATTYVRHERIFSCVDLKDIHLLPEYLHKQKIHEALEEKLRLAYRSTKLSAPYRRLVAAVKGADGFGAVAIGIVGKYTQLKDAYISLYESLNIAAYYERINLRLEWIDAARPAASITDALRKVDGLIIPGGFDTRGIPGKLAAIKHARESGLPFLGICLGMQLACIEFARNVLGLKGADSTEFDKDAKHPILDLIDKREVGLGGSLRLGSYECAIKPGTLAARIYGARKISRRHRHRYEVNNAYVKRFERAGFVFSGRNPQNDLQEIIELKDHPFFIGVQYHPEFSTTLYDPEILFASLLRAAKRGR